MIIKRLQISGLYGFMNKNIDFNDSVNLLVGINGSGKTSVLAVIDWILTLNLQEMYDTEFTFFELELLQGGKNVKIRCEKNVDMIWYRLNVDGEDYTPISLSSESVKKMAQYRDESKARRITLHPEEHEKATWNFVRELPNPISISLDRLLYIDDNKGSAYVDYSRERRSLHGSDHPTEKSAIKMVLKIFEESYNSYRNNLSDLDGKLRTKLILSLFDPNSIGATGDGQGDRKKLSSESITYLQKSVNRYLKSSVLKGNDDLSAVKRYFETIRGIMIKSKKSKEEESSLEVLNDQLEKLYNLVDNFNEYEKEATFLLSDIKKYLNVINLLFKDSNKCIKYDDSTGRLYAEILDIKRTVDIDELSSGEKQVLTLLTYIAFGRESDAIFIIDEPEISLHPKWQEEFIESVEKLIRGKTQILIATHSPAIVGMHRDYCISLYPTSE